jgi:hypothetical protein
MKSGAFDGPVLKITMRRESNTMPVQVAIDKRENTLTITMPLQSARASASGKTKVIASTHGCHVTDLKRLGRPIVVTANAFVYSGKQPKVATPNETEADSATRSKIKREQNRRSKTTWVVSGTGREPKAPNRRASVMGE